jgi:transcriptional regulator with XRE-family HTH domain
MVDALAPDVRSQFAKRLKTIRTQRGFDRARYFANALGIEENRYTRYERAEVEPSLTLIHRMCELLAVTPNELLGFMGNNARTFGADEGFAEREADPFRGDEGGGTSPPRTSSLAWRLASAVVAFRPAAGGKSGDPFDPFRDTVALFRKLQSEPFETVGSILDDPAIAKADAAKKTDLAEMIRVYTDAVSETAFPAEGH